MMGMGRLNRIVLFLAAVMFLVGFMTISAQAENDRFIYLDGSTYVLQEGGYPDANALIQEEAPQYLSVPMTAEGRAAAKHILVEGWRAKKTMISIEAYGFPSEGYPQFYWDTLNENPEFFYVGSKVGYAGGLYNAFYDTDYTDEDISLFYKTVDDILEQVPSGLTEEQKLLWVHDYLVTHCQYDYSYKNFNAYNVLVEGSAVCHGYAITYLYLMKRLGVQVYYVASNELNHAWNLAELQGDYYHIDCTWEEGKRGFCESYCEHGHFLKSEEALRRLDAKRTGTDWTANELGNVVGLADSPQYDDMFWVSVYSAIPIADGYYGYTMNGSFYLRKTDGEVSVEVSNPMLSQPVAYSGVVTDGKAFYYHSASSLFRVMTDGTVEKIHDLTEEESQYGSIQGIVSREDGLAYLVGNSFSGGSFECFRLAFPTDENGRVDAGAFDRMYRLYNPNSGEHFYTASKGERDYLDDIGWNYEGIAWRAPKASDTPVFRLYNPNAGDHHYTTNAGERDALVSIGWRDEGIGWYSEEAVGEKLYRLYNPNAQMAGAHHYSTSEAERDTLVSIGWRDEGIGWYGLQ